MEAEPMDQENMRIIVSLLAFSALLAACQRQDAAEPAATEPAAVTAPADPREAMIADALSAAPPSGPAAAMGMDWEGNRLNADSGGLSCGVAGDGGASNIAPYATGPTDDNQWVVEGPHLMIVVPDPAMLEGISTDPKNGGPYVMWKGTPYAHIMVPTAD